MKSRRFFFTLSCLVIAALILFGFGRTIGSYFLEDDLGEIFYVHQIFSGHWHQIISNFTSNYMGISTMKVYRPCLLLSIMSDYALWKTHAAGYFATNIFFLIATALILFTVLIELTRSWDRRRSTLFAFFSAALFASSPLHCESVSLMVGRVDIICAFFYLLALWSFIRKGDTKNLFLTLLGISCFWIALLTKEMAIGLPVTLTAICFLFPGTLIKKSENAGLYSNEQLKLTLDRRFSLAVKVTYPLWISCLFYFIIRYLALGTFFGGYTGSVGANQFSHIISKWADLDTIYRIIFPLNQAVFAGHNFYHNALLVIYSALGVLIFARFIVSGLPHTWLLLLVVWIITALAPIYQLWGLGFNLEGARFLFFLTIPLAMSLPLLLFAPTNTNDNLASAPLSNLSALDLKILTTGFLVLFLLALLDTKIAAKNNIPWIHAGKQIKALLQEGQKLAQSLSDEHKAIILGIPKEIDGAHVIYNGLTFNFLMSPPFSANNYSHKFITFDPILFGNGNLINTSRFKQKIISSDTSGCFVWQPNKMVFEQLELPPHKQLDKKIASVLLSFPLSKNTLLPFTRQRGSWKLNPDSIDVKHCADGTGIAIGPVSINPFAYDFMEIEAAINPQIDTQQINVSWHSDYLNPEQNNNMATASSFYSADSLCKETNDLSKDGKDPSPFANENSLSSEKNPTTYRIYRIALSRYWHWFTNKQIQGLWLEFPPIQSISIKNIRLLSNDTIIPKLNIIDLKADNTGVYQIDKQGFTLQIDASQINNCTCAKLEISKSNYFFDNFDVSNTDRAVMSSIIIDEASKQIFISSNGLPTPGYYQLRVIGLNKDGNFAGEWSDPLTIKL